MSATPPVRPAGSPAVILTPWVDTLAVGGLSILFFVPLLLTGREDLLLVGAGVQAWLAATLNMPHFLASYRMVYRSREMIRRHQWAAIWIPLLLTLYIILAIWQAQFSPALVNLLMVVSSSYLAWHYTGQAWGMMATYSHLEGAPFIDQERRYIRGSLRILLVWHLTWFFYSAELLPEVTTAYQVMTVGSLGALGLGGYGLFKAWRRTGRLPGLRVVIPWVAIFVWYAVMARDPRAIFWVQIAHATQYLIFPIRVEINTTAGQTGREPNLVRHMILYGALLLGAGVLMSYPVPATAMSFVAAALGERPGQVAPILLLTFLNIHHYFTDGVLWKLRNPAVRQELFAHLPQPSPEASSPSRRK